MGTPKTKSKKKINSLFHKTSKNRLGKDNKDRKGNRRNLEYASLFNKYEPKTRLGISAK